MNSRWTHGALIVRSEQLGLQPSPVTSSTEANGIWLETPVFVVEDSPQHLVTYIAPGARFRFPHGDWPTTSGRHPWSDRTSWSGNGCLMVQEPGAHYAVWHFWDGPNREFSCWYLNLQTAFVRTATGYATQDLELDIVVLPDGSHILKDDEVMEDRVAEGRYSAELVAWVRAYGDDLIGRLQDAGPWWDRSWIRWVPPADWSDPQLPIERVRR